MYKAYSIEERFFNTVRSYCEDQKLLLIENSYRKIFTSILILLY